MTGALKHSGEQQAQVAVPARELSANLSRMLTRYGMMWAALPH
jgi:hypothetical protein